MAEQTQQQPDGYCPGTQNMKFWTECEVFDSNGCYANARLAGGWDFITRPDALWLIIRTIVRSRALPLKYLPRPRPRSVPRASSTGNEAASIPTRTRRTISRTPICFAAAMSGPSAIRRGSRSTAPWHARWEQRRFLQADVQFLRGGKANRSGRGGRQDRRGGIRLRAVRGIQRGDCNRSHQPWTR